MNYKMYHKGFNKKQDIVYEKEQLKCDEFNSKYPIGTQMYLEDDSGVLNVIEIYGAATVVSMSACAWATGFGCYLLSRFKPII